MKTRERLHLFILVLLAACQIWINHLVISGSSPLWEDADAYQAMDIKRHSDNIRSLGIWKAAALATKIQLHPQLYQFLAGLADSRHPAGSRTELYSSIETVNGLFLCILLFSVYGIGRSIYGPGRGLLSAALVSFCPVVFGQSRLPMLEIPLAAAVSLFVCLLLNSRGFRSLPLSLAAGIAMGLAQLIKESAAVFTLPMLLVYLLQAFFSGDGKKKCLLNFSLAAAAALLLNSPVYLDPANYHIYYNYWHGFFGEYRRDPFFYLQALQHYYLGWLIFFLALPPFASFLLHIRKRNPLVTAWLLFPFTFFAFAKLKAVRFLIPAMPPLFLILANEAAGLFPGRLQKAYPVLFAAAAAFQFANLTFSLPSSHRPYQAYAVNETGLLAATEDPQVAEAERLAAIIPDHSNIVCLSFFNYWNYLQMLLKLQGKDFRYTELRPPLDMETWKDRCANADYLLDPDSGTPDRGFFPDSRTYEEFRRACLSYFELTASFSCRKNKAPAQLLLYKRKTR